MNIAIVGSGTMGRIVRDMALQNPGIEKVCNIEPALGKHSGMWISLTLS